MLASAAPLPDGASSAEILALIERLRRIPDAVRDFTRTQGWAWHWLRVRADLLTFMTEHGLPCRDIEGVARYDRYDLLNAAMQLGKGAVARSARRFWPVALSHLEQGRRPRYELRYIANCPAPGHPGACAYVLALRDGQVLHRTAQPGTTVSVAVEVSPAIEWPVLPDAAREVARTATDLEFMYLPEAIRGDVSFVRRSRLADCCGQANLLMIEALARHYPARRSFGYITAPPFATEHHWAELMVGGVWVPVDPVLIRKMVYWGALDAELWHPYRSIGSIVTRVSDQAVAPITHNGERVPAMLPVRLLSDGR